MPVKEDEVLTEIIQAWSSQVETITHAASVSLVGIHDLRNRLIDLGVKLEEAGVKADVTETLMTALKHTALTEYMLADTIGAAKVRVSARTFLKETVGLDESQVEEFVKTAVDGFKKMRGQHPKVSDIAAKMDLR